MCPWHVVRSSFLFYFITIWEYVSQCFNVSFFEQYISTFSQERTCFPLPMLEKKERLTRLLHREGRK